MTRRKEKYLQREGSVSSVADAFSDLEGLKEELEEWFGNMPESFQNGSKGEQLQSAIDILESLQEPNVPDEVADLSIQWPESLGRSRKGPSRSTRCSNACNVIESAKSAVESWIEEQEESADTDAAETFVGELDELISEASSVEFPGMFG